VRSRPPYFEETPTGRCGRCLAIDNQHLEFRERLCAQHRWRRSTVEQAALARNCHAIERNIFALSSPCVRVARRLGRRAKKRRRLRWNWCPTCTPSLDRYCGVIKCERRSARREACSRSHLY
jgi:hypothetical protein